MAFRSWAVAGRVCPVFVPRAYDASRTWPAIVFLHGVGENGTDGERHLAWGLPEHVRAHADTFPAFVLAPQNRGPWKYVGDDERFVLDVIDAAVREWTVDPRRIYAIGQSQGGCSTFDLGARHPDCWAALVVICGAGNLDDAARITAPTWIFHGELDDIVPPSGPHRWEPSSAGGRDMARRIPHARYTEFAGADHFVWDRVYADAAFWEWLFAQARGQAARGSPKPTRDRPPGRIIGI
jgi:predicted peptidase